MIIIRINKKFKPLLEWKMKQVQQKHIQHHPSNNKPRAIPINL